MGGKTKAKKEELAAAFGRVRQMGYDAGYRDGYKSGREAGRVEAEQVQPDLLDRTRRVVPLPGRPPDAPPDWKAGREGSR